MVDVVTIQTALGLASSAMGATGSLVSVAERIKSLVSSGKPSDAELNGLVNQLARELTAANMQNVQLSTTLAALAAELEREDEFQKTKARYELFKTDGWDFVWKLKDEFKNEEPMHFACPICMSEGKRSFATQKGGGGPNDWLECQRCRHHFDLR